MSDFRLKVFCCAARHLSYTKAAQELFISQPAITKHVQELETQYKVCLFERLGNKIALTEAGKLLLERSEQILEAYNRLAYEMSLLQGEYTGELRLGASTTIAQYVLPPLLAQFTSKFPKVKVSMLNGNTRDIEQALQEHQVDLGLVEGISRQPNLKYTHFLDDELVAILRTGSKGGLNLPEEISPEELQQQPLVLRERGSGTLDVIEQALQQHHIKLSSLNIVMHLGSTESIKRFLECANCIGIISIRSVARELQAGKFRVIEIKGMPMQRELSFVQLHGQENGLPETFIDFCRINGKSI